METVVADFFQVYASTVAGFIFSGRFTGNSALIHVFQRFSVNCRSLAV